VRADLRMSDVDSLARLRLLLGVLADSDCERRGRLASAGETEETLRWYRARFNLLRRRDLESFLATAKLDEAELVRHMQTFSNIALAQETHREEVARRMDRYKAVFSVRDWLIRREP
jgi:hypothetical protein